MSISSKHKAAMAAIIAAGALAIAGVLFTGGSHDDHHEPGHDEAAEPGHPAPESGSGHADRGVVRLTHAQLQAAGIQVLQAGPGKIAQGTEFPGEIRLNEDRTAHVVPRLAGTVESVPVTLGQQVRKGEVLAVIASPALSEQRSEWLAARKRLALAETVLGRERQLWEQKISAEQDYLQARAAREEAQIALENARQKLRAIGAAPDSAQLNQLELRAPFDAMIVEKHISLGEAVSDSSRIFTLSDLGELWAEFAVAPQDLALVRTGKHAAISSSATRETTEGVVTYVGSLLGEQTRTAKARVTLKNPGAAWRPGLFITVKVHEQDADVPLAVPAGALQTIDNHTVVFAQVEGGFKALAVKTGRGDGQWVEVLDGLQPGAAYAASNTFTLKAELGKSSAEHAH